MKRNGLLLFVGLLSVLVLPSVTFAEMVISGDNVGIGKNTPTSTLDVYSTTGTAIQGISTAGPGVYGYSFADPGVSGNSNSNVGVSGYSFTHYGVSGYSSSGVGVYGTSPNYAGFFDGRVNVTGDQTVGGSQSVSGNQTVSGWQEVRGSQAVWGPQTVGGSQLVAGNTTATKFYGDGSALTNVNAGTLNGQSSSDIVMASANGVTPTYTYNLPGTWNHFTGPFGGEVDVWYANFPAVPAGKRLRLTNVRALATTGAYHSAACSPLVLFLTKGSSSSFPLFMFEMTDTGSPRWGYISILSQQSVDFMFEAGESPYLEITCLGTPGPQKNCYMGVDGYLVDVP